MDNKGKIGSALLYGLTWPLARLPLKFHRACGRALGRFLGKTVRYRRDEVMINLSRCFPELDYWHVRAVCDRFYEHLGKVFTEAIWFGGCTDPGRLVDSRIVRISNPEAVNRFREDGRSVVVLTSHSGNWELYGGIESYPHPQRLAYPEQDVCVIYRRQASPAVDRFLGRNRIAPLEDKKHYDGRVESFEALRYILRHRDCAKMYIFINDQYPYTSKSKVRVRFMGQDTWAMDAAENLARHMGYPVVYLSTREEDDGNYTMNFIPVCDNAAEMPEGAILSRYFELLEQDLREQPWNYLWTHRRWK